MFSNSSRDKDSLEAEATWPITAARAKSEMLRAPSETAVFDSSSNSLSARRKVTACVLFLNTILLVVT